MGCVDVAWRSIFKGVHGDDHVEPQESQVCQVFLRQGLSLKVRVDETEASETRDTCSKPGEIGKRDAALVTYQDIFDGASPSDQDPDLPSDFTGEFCQQPCDVGRNDSLRRDPLPVEAFDPFDLTGLQADNVPVDSVNRTLPDCIQLNGNMARE